MFVGSPTSTIGSDSGARFKKRPLFLFSFFGVYIVDTHEPSRYRPIHPL